MTSTSMIGTNVARSDAEAKVRGSALFGVDFTLPGTLHARVLRSRVPAGRIVGIDTSAAAGLAGVHDVITGADGPDWRTGVILADIPFLARDYLAFEGEPLAVVVAGEPPQPPLADHEILTSIPPFPF